MILYKFGFHALFPGESPVDSREFHFYPPLDQPPVPRCRREGWPLGSFSLDVKRRSWEEAEQVPRPCEKLHNAQTKSVPDLPVLDGPGNEAL